jgi:hypothetical protein
VFVHMIVCVCASVCVHVHVHACVCVFMCMHVSLIRLHLGTYIPVTLRFAKNYCTLPDKP